MFIQGNGFGTDDLHPKISSRGSSMRVASLIEFGRTMSVTKTAAISRRAIPAAMMRHESLSEADRETWYVGEPITCVNSGFLDLADAPELVEGALYTIAAIWPKRRGHYGLELREVDAKAIYVAFDERRFRPASSS